MREALEIRKGKFLEKNILNRDDGCFIKTTTWDPLLKAIAKNEEK